MRAASLTQAADDNADFEFFEKRIRPVLIEHCYECHSGNAKKLRAGLRLDSREVLRKGGESGPAIMPGKPSESRNSMRTINLLCKFPARPRGIGRKVQILPPQPNPRK